ncbi:P-type Ca(2+) transporter [Malassezia sp. CBS 17886]|nr:P-type Ca(2+) transporter [Malassezia sp. CBS 17886]
MEQAWTQPAGDVLKHFQVRPDSGLDEAQLEDEPATPLWKLILEQFEDQLVLILLASAVISLVLALLENEGGLANALVEPTVIFLILIANATVGVLQERNAGQAIEALRAYSPEQAIVVRDGTTSRVEAAALVPGDIVMLSTGDRVPADCRVVEMRSTNVQVDQAILTGESESVYKNAAVVADPQAVKQDMTNILFAGTSIVSGACTAAVVLTGEHTAIGSIHTEIGQDDDTKTPLQEKLDEFGNLLAKAIMVICILVWVVNVRNFFDPSHHGWVRGAIYYFKIAVALAVAAIPEGLAAVITACLALGTQKMAKKHAIVRHLPSVETLGSTSVICSDKTGTLTTNQMSVTRVFFPAAHAEFAVEGTSFAPEGKLVPINGTDAVLALNRRDSVMHVLVEACAVCNDAKLSVDENGQYKALGQATEGALKTLVEKIGHHDPLKQTRIGALVPTLRANAVGSMYAEALPRLQTLEFSRDRKMMSVMVRHGASHGGRLLVKGAPEAVLQRTSSLYVDASSTVPLDNAARADLLSMVEAYGADGLRVMAVAVRDHVTTSHMVDEVPASEYASMEQDLALVALVGMRDPPRQEVRDAVYECMQAGVRVVVITGDSKATAEAVCRQIGLLHGDEKSARALSITGRDLDAMRDTEKAEVAKKLVVLSRTEPSHKSQMVDILQRQGEVVAMTGDGVNDAPALKRADIGVAMGTGTDVAKLAADMVLADNNFATIVTAIQEGRSIFNNTQSFIRYLISSNIGEVVSIFLTVLLGMPEALIPVQLLWVNLVTDGLPATALGFNPPDGAVMKLPPRRRDDPLISAWLFFRYMLIGLFVGVATVFGYAWWFTLYSGGPQISFYQLTHFHRCSASFPHIGCGMFTDVAAQRASTISLSILVTIEMLNALNSLSEVDSLLTHPPFRNMWLLSAIALSMGLHMIILYTPYFASIFSVQPLNAVEWFAVIAISAPVLLLDEACKWWARRALQRNMAHVKKSQ